MIINNIDPVLLGIGPVEIRYYGLVYAIGFLCVYLWLNHNIKKGILKLTEEKLDMFLVWLIVGSIVMARLVDVFIYNLPLYKDNLLDVFRIWDGGLAYHGGIIGAVLVTYMFAKKNKLKFWELADLLTLPAALFLAIGKIANYINSELYGKAAAVPWCVVFARVDNICRHPVQIYEAISVFIIFGILAWYYSYHRRHKKETGGKLFWAFMLLYSITRFIITFYRDEPALGGLNVGQWLSMILFAVSSYALYRIHGKNCKTKSI